MHSFFNICILLRKGDLLKSLKATILHQSCCIMKQVCMLFHKCWVHFPISTLFRLSMPASDPCPKFLLDSPIESLSMVKGTAQMFAILELTLEELLSPSLSPYRVFNIMLLAIITHHIASCLWQIQVPDFLTLNCKFTLKGSQKWFVCFLFLQLHSTYIVGAF